MEPPRCDDEASRHTVLQIFARREGATLVGRASKGQGARGKVKYYVKITGDYAAITSCRKADCRPLTSLSAGRLDCAAAPRAAAARQQSTPKR